MPLVSATLATALAGVFAAKLPTSVAAAQQMAAAYSTYAATGLFGLGVPVIAPANTLAMQNAIALALAVPQLGTPATFGQAWAAGLLAFWTVPPVLVTGGQTGTVLACAGSAAVVAPITAAVLNLVTTPQITAQLISLALHTASLTTTALVTNVVPVPPTIVLTLL